MSKYFITSSLPYVHNVPHLGNLIGSVLSADVYARFCRLKGRNTLFLCGTDEYGTATEIKAHSEQCSPQELCDTYHLLHRKIYQLLDISFDVFGRTSTPTHTQICQDVFRDLAFRGYLEEGQIDTLYCSSCQRFLADRYVEEECPYCFSDGARGDQCDSCGKIYDSTLLKNPRCSLCDSPVDRKKRKHIFFNLSKLQPKLEAWIKTWNQASPLVRGITQSWLSSPGSLGKMCISRDLRWGVPLPKTPFFPDDEYKNKVMYVWFDAPLGYLSILASSRNDWNEEWLSSEKTQWIAFMGKDNVSFHTLTFPAMLMATGHPYILPSTISTTHYLMYCGQKFSKSRNVGIFGDMLERLPIPIDFWRYYLLRIRPE